jgi:hypothetical protein
MRADCTTFLWRVYQQWSVWWEAGPVISIFCQQNRLYSLQTQEGTGFGPRLRIQLSVRTSAQSWEPPLLRISHSIRHDQENQNQVAPLSCPRCGRIRSSNRPGGGGQGKETPVLELFTAPVLCAMAAPLSGANSPLRSLVPRTGDYIIGEDRSQKGAVTFPFRSLPYHVVLGAGQMQTT